MAFARANPQPDLTAAWRLRSGVHMDASISLERKHTGFVATRDIEAGEEITCSYPHPSALPEERAAVLRQFLLDEGG